MKLFSTLAAQQAAEQMSPPQNLFTIFQAYLGRIIERIFAPAKIAILLLPVVLLSLLVTPAAPAYAQTTTATLTPRQIVEYALTLEKLEADFYRRANSAVSQGRLGNVPQIARDALVSYGEDEAQHVRDLSPILTSLGGNPDAVTIPANPNYNAILNRDPFANVADLLLAGQYVEDLGVAAYKGQAPNLLAAGDAAEAVLAGALAIHSVEARHAAGIRFLRETLLGTDVRPWIRNANEVVYREVREGSPVPFASDAFDGYATRDEVLALVGPILTAQTPPTTGQPTPPTTGQPTTPRRPIPALW